MERERRSAKRSLPLEALAQLRAAKNAGLKRSEQVILREEKNIYEELDEAEYARVIAQRRAESNFVIDDDGEYMDDGEDDWDDRDFIDGEAHPLKRARTLRGQGNRQLKSILPSQPTGPVSGVFLGGARTIGPSTAASSAADGAGEDDDVVKSLLRSLEMDPLDEGIKVTEPAKNDLTSVAMFGLPPQLAESVDDLYDLYDEREAQKLQREKREALRRQNEERAAQQRLAEARETAQQQQRPQIKEESLPIESSIIPDSLDSGFEIADFTEDADEASSGRNTTTNTTATAAVIDSYVSVAMANTSPVANDSITMYWYDIYEDAHTPGTVYLFGKVLLPDGKCSGSCCVRVNGMKRNLYFLSRKNALQNVSDESSVTDRKVGKQDVYSEVNNILKTKGVSKFECKYVQRKYCFDREVPQSKMESLIDPENGVPQNAEYLKVVYPFQDPPLDRKLKGCTFSKVFGTRSSAQELFILECKLMGPSWIKISNVKPVQQAVSWCKYEFTIDSTKNIEHILDAPPPPHFSMLSLSLKTVLDEKTQGQQIVMCSYLFHDAVNIDGSTAQPGKATCQTLVSKVNGTSLPFDFLPQVKSLNLRRKGKSTRGERLAITICESERALLALLLCWLHRDDPDIILSHDLHGSIIDSLLTRIDKCKVPMWSKIGRLSRGNMPTSSNRGDNFSLVDRGVGCGRLMVDTMVCAQEFLTGQRTYALTHLCMSQLNIERREVEPSQVFNCYSSSTDLLEIMKHTDNDCWLTLRLLFSLQLLPLTKQLTNLCGNLWSRTLRSIRSERVEYLLLHRFYNSDYIVPEKYTSQERREQEGLTNVKSGKKRGKPQYSGGLVLEPKKGFYDKFVLLLDFNSLYPSIIQQYNICFTTLPHWTMKKATSIEYQEEEQETAEEDYSQHLPSVDERGVLPEVIAELVSRRRDVKKELKKARDPAKIQMYDIRQKALKLVANSMYGCLGFTSSRFYCFPMAAMITSQGRETLTRAVEVASTQGANVIYGDTDSIMIDTGRSELHSARELGIQIKKEINKQHTVLEIDIDGVYKNMLLLRKKKYAALKVDEKNDGSLCFTREVKGLDMVRRDWSGLSKEVSKVVLDLILSDKSRDDVVELIHSYLQQIREDIYANRIVLDKYVITKGLTKPVADYGPNHNQPHVTVALQLQRKGMVIQAGAFIPYVICEGNGSMAQRAFDPKTVMTADGMLAVDKQWYLANQVLPPIARLCSVIEETDAGRLANCLGLDARQFAHAYGDKSDTVDDDYKWLLEEDEDKWKGTKPLDITCTICGKKYEFSGALRMKENPPVKQQSPTSFNTTSSSSSTTAELKSDDNIGLEGVSTASSAPVEILKRVIPCGLRCPSRDCAASMEAEEHLQNILKNELLLAQRNAVTTYYSSNYTCSDSSCQYHGRECGVSQRDQCQVSRCDGKIRRVYSAHDLYTQLSYYAMLFDVNKWIEKAQTSPSSSSTNDSFVPSHISITETEKRICKVLYEQCLQLKQQSAYNFLSPSIFRFTSVS